MVELHYSNSDDIPTLDYWINDIHISVSINKTNDAKILKIIREVIKEELENNLKVT